MPNTQADRRTGKGVRGWRAFLLVFGCGTTAALVFVAAIVGGARMLASGFSPSSPGPASGTESREPRETTPPELLDLCELVEAQSLMSASPYNRTSDDDVYSDTAVDDPEADPRTVSDDCAWEVTAGSTSVWDFELSYRAFLETEGNTSLEELAEAEFSDRMDAAGEEIPTPDSEGAVPGMPGESHQVYDQSASSGDSYLVIRIMKSGVYQIKLTGPSESTAEPTSEQDFRQEALKVARYLDRAFERQIPDA
ncbi:hypothetical protein ACFO4E_01525 [Nocardiopsis mangrovi]|uniref:DUF3558 domain-containing protein n=1 Tax=Nocardiopsis mangrovi TaxID=1179818 RepID=A0ABV9DPE6_9ACTN